MRKVWFYLLLISIIIIKLCLSVLLIIKDRNNVENVCLKLTSSDFICSDHITAYRESTNGKITELTEKELNYKKNILQIKADNDKLFFKGIGIKITKDCIHLPDKIFIKIGSKEYGYTYKQVIENWQKIKYGSNWIFLATTDQLSKNSYIPSINNIINWSGDKRLFKSVLADSSSLIILISILILLSIFESKIFNISKLTDKLISTFFVLTIIIFAVFKFPFDIQSLAPGLDPSWVTALNWANVKGYKWGEDIVFTYGPLYWLVKPSIILNNNDLSRYALVTFLVYISCISILIYYLRILLISKTLSIIEIITILSVLFLFHFELLDYMTIAILILLLNIIKIDSKNKLVKIAVIAVLLATMSLVKFSYFSIAVSLILIVGLSSFKDKNRLIAVLQIGIYYAISLIALWILSEQPIYNLYKYIYNGLDITRGYSEAMSTPIWDETTSKLSNFIDIIFLLLTVFMLLALSWIFTITYKVDRMRIALLISAPLVFLAFKEGFVRFDVGHLLLFYSQLLLLSIFLFIIYKEVHGNYLVSQTLIIISSVCCLTASPFSFFSKNDLLLLLNNENAKIELANQKKMIRNNFAFTHKTREIINKHTKLDIIPWDISLAYAYNSNWYPRPIFQSYSVYTPGLANLNAKLYSSENSPEYLLYSLKSIDNRYPFFDEPELNLFILNQYEVIENNLNSYLVLQKRKKKIRSVLINGKVQLMNFHDKFKIQRQTNSHTLISINSNLTLLGQVLNFFYKIPPLKITMYDNNNNSLGDFRLIRKTAGEKLLISSFIKDVNTFEKLFHNHSEIEVSSFSLKGNSLFYGSKFQITTSYLKFASSTFTQNLSLVEKTSVKYK